MPLDNSLYFSTYLRDDFLDQKNVLEWLHKCMKWYHFIRSSSQELMKVQNIWLNQIQFFLLWFELLYHLIWFPIEMHYKHNMHSHFWKQCHKVATIQNKMHLWFCIYLWFLKYSSIAMHWLTLEISSHYNANSTSSSFTSSLHTPWSKFLFSTPFCFLAHF